MDIQTLKRKIDNDEITMDMNSIVCSGKISQFSGQQENFFIHNGWDIVKARKCDVEWTQFNLSLFDFIEQNYSTEEERDIVLENVQVQDSHWNWFNKSACFRSNEYEWFFLVINDRPEAVCLIYHPKKSNLEPGDIFYVEYIAVAPWNRKNPMQERLYSGIGTKLLKFVLRYANEVLSLKLGMSLSALKEASSFYEKIGMTRVPELDANSLQYFEMKSEPASIFLGGTNNG